MYTADKNKHASEWSALLSNSSYQSSYHCGFPKCFSESNKTFVITVKGLKPATSCVRNQDVTTMPTRHTWETGSLNWAQLMLQWFIRFSEFAEITEFNESSTAFSGNSIHIFKQVIQVIIRPYGYSNLQVMKAKSIQYNATHVYIHRHGHLSTSEIHSRDI